MSLSPEDHACIRSCIVCYKICESIQAIKHHEQQVEMTSSHSSEGQCSPVHDCTTADYVETFIRLRNVSSQRKRQLSQLKSVQSSDALIPCKQSPTLRNEYEDTLCLSNDQCLACHELHDSWVCLICGHRGCGRYKSKHAQQHALDTQHSVCIQVSTGHIWDYQREAFVHRQIFYPSLCFQSDFSRVIRLSSSVPRSSMLMIEPQSFETSKKHVDDRHAYTSVLPLCSRDRSLGEDESDRYTERHLLKEEIMGSHSSLHEAKIQRTSRAMEESHDTLQKELQGLLESQIQFQHALYWKKWCDVQEREWTSLKAQLNKCDALQATVQDLECRITQVKRALHIQLQKKRKTEKANQKLSASIQELRCFNEALLKKLNLSTRTIDLEGATALENTTPREDGGTTEITMLGNQIKVLEDKVMFSMLRSSPPSPMLTFSFTAYRASFKIQLVL